jgi:hypothetical protein
VEKAMTYDVQIEIQTRKDLSSWETGHAILSVPFSQTGLAPQRVATLGEVTPRHGHNVESIEECEPHWGIKTILRSEGTAHDFTLPFNWKRKNSLKSYGDVDFSILNNILLRYPATISFCSKYKKGIDFLFLFRNWCEVTSPFAAILHPFFLEDGLKENPKSVMEYNNEEDFLEQAWSRFLHGSLYAQFRFGEMNSLRSGLTNLGWASWFGDEFADEVDERAISAAGFPVSRIGNGFLVQVTKQIEDVKGNFPLFSRRRAELKSLFRPGLFMIADEPARHSNTSHMDVG